MPPKKTSTKTESTKTDSTIIIDDIIKKNSICNKTIDVFESHSYEISKLPSSLVSIAKSMNCKNEIIQYKERPIFGTQFHPEVSPDGNDLIEKFCFL